MAALRNHCSARPWLGPELPNLSSDLLPDGKASSLPARVPAVAWSGLQSLEPRAKVLLPFPLQGTMAQLNSLVVST